MLRQDRNVWLLGLRRLRAGGVAESRVNLGGRRGPDWRLIATLSSLARAQGEQAAATTSKPRATAEQHRGCPVRWTWTGRHRL